MMLRDIRFKVGLFVIITSVMITAFIGYTAYKKGVFSKEHTFTLSSNSGENLTVGMPVVFAGFKIGRVDSMELNTAGMVIIKIKVPDRHIRWIRADSVFVLEKPLIGSARIHVATANLKAPALPEDLVPKIVEVNDISDAVKSIQPILEKISNISHHVEVLTSNLSDPSGDLANILSNTRNATKQADGIFKKIDALVIKTDEQIYGNRGVLPHVRTILKDLSVKLKKMDPLLENLHTISTDTSDATRDLQLLRQDIDRMVHDINGVLSDIEKLIPLQKDTQLKVP